MHLSECKMQIASWHNRSKMSAVCTGPGTWNICTDEGAVGDAVHRWETRPLPASISSIEWSSKIVHPFDTNTILFNCTSYTGRTVAARTGENKRKGQINEEVWSHGGTEKLKKLWRLGGENEITTTFYWGNRSGVVLYPPPPVITTFPRQCRRQPYKQVDSPKFSRVKTIAETLRNFVNNRL